MAAMPICQKRPTLELTICSVIAPTIPTTAALNPENSAARGAEPLTLP